MKIRESVLFFAGEMEKKLRENDHKGGWDHLELEYLKKRLWEEVNELFVSINEGDYENIIKEVADVGNFSMMIADIVSQKVYPGLIVREIPRKLGDKPAYVSINHSSLKEDQYREQYGMYRGYYNWDLTIAYLTMDNDTFFNCYGFNYSPDSQLSDIARLHLQTRETVQAATLPASMLKGAIESIQEREKEMINQITNTMPDKKD